MIFHESLTVDTSKQLEVLDITERVKELVKRTNVHNGLVNLWTVHTTAALTVNENDKGLWTDLLTKFNKLVPVKGDYHHKPNAHAHILSILVKPDITVPINNGEMVLGTWQKVLFLELDGPRKRTLKATIIGE